MNGAVYGRERVDGGDEDGGVDEGVFVAGVFGEELGVQVGCVFDGLINSYVEGPGGREGG